MKPCTEYRQFKVKFNTKKYSFAHIDYYFQEDKSFENMEDWEFLQFPNKNAFDDFMEGENTKNFLEIADYVEFKFDLFI